MFQFPGFASPKPILFSLVIPLPFNPASDCSETRLNGEGGFPHSEICGSKVAHTLPQLIAACHVLHRLCMPRHPRIALTSRLRIHTISDKIGTRRRDGAGRCINARRSRPERQPLTQLDNRFNGRHTRLPLGRRTARSKKRVPPRHRFLEPIHNVKERGEPLRSARRTARRSGLHPWKNSWWSLSGSNR